MATEPDLSTVQNWRCAMLNVVVLVGRLTRAPELRYTGAGVAVAHFTLAVDRPFTSQDGERGTDFIPVVCWRQLGETVSQHLKQGRLVAVRGSLNLRKYETPDGQRRTVAEVRADDVRFLDSPRETGGEPSAARGTGEGA